VGVSFREEDFHEDVVDRFEVFDVQKEHNKTEKIIASAI